MLDDWVKERIKQEFRDFIEEIIIESADECSSKEEFLALASKAWDETRDELEHVMRTYDP